MRVIKEVYEQAEKSIMIFSFKILFLFSFLPTIALILIMYFDPSLIIRSGTSFQMKAFFVIAVATISYMTIQIFINPLLKIFKTKDLIIYMDNCDFYQSESKGTTEKSKDRNEELKNKNEYSIFIFGSCDARMGSPTPYLLAINESDVLTAPSITETQFKKIYNELDKEIPSNEIINDVIKEIKFYYPNNKGGWEMDSYPIQRLLSRDKGLEDDELAIYNKNNFTKKSFVNAGMGNFGMCAGLYELQRENKINDNKKEEIENIQNQEIKI